MTAAELVTLLVEAVPAAKRDEVESVPELATTLDRHLAEIAAAWPTVSLDQDCYIRRLADSISRRKDEPPRRVIETMPAADLYLAAACTNGDPVALAIFRNQLVPGLRQALGTIGIPPATIDETQQRVLVMLFVGDAPQIAGYTGRGQLRSWLRSVGVRTGRRLAGVLNGNDADSDGLDALPAAVRDPELEVLRTRYGDEVRQAFAAALAGLSEKQRTLLRQHHIDGLTIDQLAVLYRINRATAARWVAGARLEVVTSTRERLVTEAGVPKSEVDSIIRLVRSQLSVSLRQLE